MSRQRVWEDLGSEDPLWAILSDDTKRLGGWDVDEFFATGEADIESALAKADQLGLPKERGTALDFGCGVGRLTRALSRRFANVHGVDVSSTMIARARELNDELGTKIQFVTNTAPDLRIFPGESFDFVYSRLVLQHLPRRSLIVRFIGEFVRTLRPGGLVVFQLPSAIPLRQRVQSHRRLYPILRAVGFSPSYLLRNLKLTPMPLMALDEQTVQATIDRAGGRVVRVDHDDSAGPSVASRFYYATKG